MSENNNMNNQTTFNLTTILGLRKYNLTKELDNKFACSLGPWKVQKLAEDNEFLELIKAKKSFFKSSKKRPIEDFAKSKIDESNKDSSSDWFKPLGKSQQENLEIFNQYKPEAIACMMPIPINYEWHYCFHTVVAIVDSYLKLIGIGMRQYESIEECETVFDNSIISKISAREIDVKTTYEQCLAIDKDMFENNIQQLFKACLPNNIDQSIKDKIDKGLCFGLTSTFFNAILVNDLSTFVRRLQFIGNTVTPYSFMGKYYNDLSGAIEAAYTKYKEYSKQLTHQHLTSEQMYDQFKTQCPDAFFLMELRAWFENVLISQISAPVLFDNTLSYQKLITQFNYVGSKALEQLKQLEPDQKHIKSNVHATQAWPLPLHKDQLKAFLQQLPNSCYYISTGYHAFGLVINDVQCMLFDQNHHNLITQRHKAQLDNSDIATIFKSFHLNGQNKNAVTFDITALSTNKSDIAPIDNALKEMSFSMRNAFHDKYNIEDTQLIKGDRHRSQLFLAVIHNNLAAVTELLNLEQHREELKNDDGFLILRAALYGYGDVVKALIKGGSTTIYHLKKTQADYEIISVHDVSIQLKERGRDTYISNTNKSVFY